VLLLQAVGGWELIVKCSCMLLRWSVCCITLQRPRIAVAESSIHCSSSLRPARLAQYSCCEIHAHCSCPAKGLHWTAAVGMNMAAGGLRNLCFACHSHLRLAGDSVGRVCVTLSITSCAFTPPANGIAEPFWMCKCVLVHPAKSSAVLQYMLLRGTTQDHSPASLATLLL
jgi:hypothetical protein